ncbi:MAG TPA: proton-conducting transporter membrane subunit [Mycobacteriales bacterium]|nr:proton-conducting transporter membrane subunit [Mycobacteriales bacterium]
MSAGQLAPLVVAIPLAVAASLAAVGRWLPRLVRDATAVAAASASVGLSAYLVADTGHSRAVEWLGGWLPVHGKSVGIVFVVDRLSASLALLVTSLVVVALVYSIRYFDDVQSHYHVLVLAFLGGMAGFALTGDLFDMFVFFELMGTAAYALTGYKVEEKAPLQAALNFGVVNSLGAYLTLIGIGLIYARTGELGLAQIGGELQGHHADGLVVAAFVLVLTGWLVKAAVAPFHFWLADAHAVAPSPVCVLFSGVMVVLGVYGVFRVYVTAFAGVLPADDVRRALLVVGVLTALVGAVMCLLQSHLKRMLAFSTIAHVGLFTMSASMLSADGVGGAAAYVAGHAGAKGTLFLCCGVLLSRTGSVDEIDLYGRGRRMRFLAAVWMVAGLALAGMPPFGTFIGKSMGEDALAAEGYHWAPALFVAVSALTAGTVLRAGMRVFFGVGDVVRRDAPAGPEGEDEEPETTGSRRLRAVPATMALAITALVGGSLAVGIAPGLPTALANAAAQFLDGADYARQALSSAPAAHLPAEHVSAWTHEGVLLSILSVILSAFVAVASGFGSRLARRRRRSWQLVTAGAGGFQRLHSGHLGDYVAWLLLGVAGLAALVGVPLR